MQFEFLPRFQLCIRAPLTITETIKWCRHCYVREKGLVAGIPILGGLRRDTLGAWKNGVQV